jgi:hypothetical protein
LKRLGETSEPVTEAEGGKVREWSFRRLVVRTYLYLGDIGIFEMVNKKSGVCYILFGRELLLTCINKNPLHEKNLDSRKKSEFGPQNDDSLW